MGSLKRVTFWLLTMSMFSSWTGLLAGPKWGIDLAHITEQMQPNAAIPIVSADARSEMANFPARAIFLRKPFGSEKLLHAIKRARAQVNAYT
jgi:FixJ family two-component response regulator